MKRDATLREAQARRQRLRAAIDGIEALFPLSGFTWGASVYEPHADDPLRTFKLDLVAQAVDAVEQATMQLLGRPVPSRGRFQASAFDAARRARVADALATDPQRAEYLRLCDAIVVAAAALRAQGAAVEGLSMAAASEFSDPAPRDPPMELDRRPA